MTNVGTNTATFIGSTGRQIGPTIDIINPAGVTTAPGPVAAVFNPTRNFTFTQNGLTVPANFIIANQSGTISAFNSRISRTTAFPVVNRATAGARFIGLTTAQATTGPQLLALNATNYTVEAFDTNFQPVTLAPGAFTDPSLPAGFTPASLQNIRGDVFVTFVMRDPFTGQIITGPGTGVVDVFDASGNLINRFVAGGTLNAPTSVALAPRRFGNLSNSVLVSNFGTGTITAFDPFSGEELGQLVDLQGNTLTIPGLQSISTGGRVTRRGQLISGNQLFVASTDTSTGTGADATSTVSVLRPFPRFGPSLRRSITIASG